MAAPSEPRDPETPAASLDKGRSRSPRFNENTVPPNRSLRRARDTIWRKWGPALQRVGEVYQRDYRTRFNGADRLTLRSRTESRRSVPRASREKIHGPASAGELMRPGRSREEISRPTCAASAIKKGKRSGRGDSFFSSRFSFLSLVSLIRLRLRHRSVFGNPRAQIYTGDLCRYVRTRAFRVERRTLQDAEINCRAPSTCVTK